jgi:hypothetical protein
VKFLILVLDILHRSPWLVYFLTRCFSRSDCS